MPENLHAQAYLTPLRLKGYTAQQVREQGTANQRGEEVYLISKRGWSEGAGVVLTFTQTYRGTLKFKLVSKDTTTAYRLYRALNVSGLLTYFKVSKDYSTYTTNSRILSPTGLLHITQISYLLATKNYTQLNLYISLLPRIGRG